MGGTEMKYIQEAFRENWIAPLGPNVDIFEKNICQYIGGGSAVALSSGTAAIHLALILLKVGREDSVICPSFTFSASANPIVYQGAQPIFVDSEPETWNMDPHVLQQAIEDQIKKGKKPKAVIFVHLYGMPGKIDEVVDICNHFDIPLIEDAAEALGSVLKGKKVGTFGDFGIFSFNGNKIITTSGGGALVSHDKELVDKARYLASQARDPAPYYQHSEIGYNYRMSNIAAGIGRGQMEVLDRWIAKRRSHFDYYKNSLENVSGISFLEEPSGFFSNRWLTTILIDSKVTGVSTEIVRIALENENIESRPLWKPMHLQPIFKSAQYYYHGNSISEQLFDQGLCLPSGSNMTTEHLNDIVSVIKRSLKI